MKKQTKNIAGFILFSLSASFIMSQEIVNEGTIAYEQTVKLDIQLDGIDSQMSQMLPKERKSNKVLYFTPENALYQNDNNKSNEDDMEMNSEGGSIMIKMIEPENILFTDLKSRHQIEQREFMTRMFLIESEMDGSKWKITSNQKNILGYPCQEATCEEGEDKISAWFTSVIPVSAGPANYGDLPGMILEINKNEGEMSIIAKSISTEPVNESIMTKPKKGKKVSKEEFKTIVEEKMKESGMDGDGSGQQIMIKISQEAE